MNQSNYLQESISSDNFTTWRVGPLGDLGFQSLPTATSMASIVFYPDDTNSTRGNLRLYAGGLDNLVHELHYSFGADSWVSGFTFDNTKGNAGISATAIGESTQMPDLFVLDNDNNIRVWTLDITQYDPHQDFSGWRLGGSSFLLFCKFTTCLHQCYPRQENTVLADADLLLSEIRPELSGSRSCYEYFSKLRARLGCVSGSIQCRFRDRIVF